MIVISRSLIVVSSWAILVLVAFNSRFRKLIFAASGDIWVLFGLARFLVKGVGSVDGNNPDETEDEVVEVIDVQLVFVTVTELVSGIILGVDVEEQVEAEDVMLDGIEGSNTEILLAVVGIIE